MSTASDIYGALNTAGLAYSAMSWSGFNLFGDQPSIDELKRLQNVDVQVDAYWRPNHIHTEMRLQQAMTVVAEANNSLFGSHGYFTSLNGGEYDKLHLARAIEDLKAGTKGPPLAWFRQSSQNPKAWYQIDAADVKMHKDRGDVVRAVYE